MSTTTERPLLANRYAFRERLPDTEILSIYGADDERAITAAEQRILVKTLQNNYANRRETEGMLLAGLQQARSVEHPGMARIREVEQDTAEGKLFFVEEDKGGRPLRVRLQQGGLTAGEALRLMLPVVEAVEVAHAQGVVHCDIRPENIAIDPAERGYLCNFGVAYTLRTLARSNPSMLRPSFPYMAPETGVEPAAGEDIYAIGAVLYELLTGKQPSAAGTSVRAVVPTLSPVLDGVVRKALATDPKERYASVTALRKDLQKVPAEKKEEVPIPVPEPSAKTREIAVVPPTVPTSVASQEVAPTVMPRVEEEEPELDKRGRPRRRRSTGWLTFLNLFLFLVLTGMIGGLVYVAMPLFQPAGETVVPNLVNLSLDEAAKKAREQNFNLIVVDQKFRDDVKKDVIYHQDPPVGRHIRQGKPVSVDVSRGPRMVEVPDVVQLSKEKAVKVLEKAGLKMGKWTGEHDLLVPKGSVISQKPEAGENLKRNGEVEVVISKGEEPLPIEQPTPMPNVPEVETPLVDDNRQRSFKVPQASYQIPNDGEPHIIRIDINDVKGTRTAYEQTHKPGTKFQQEIIGQGLSITIQMYDNDQLVMETVQ